MLIIETNTTDPAENLAYEEYFLHREDLTEPILMLWRNEPTVVVGAFQNTYNEVDDDYLKAKGIHLIRRTTGGGAVYHDLGNLCYSFIRVETDLEELNFQQFLKPVQSALASLGVDAEISGRNDLLIGGQKISGSAARIFGDRVLFHGTLLFSSDLSILGRALTVQREKIASKGFASVRSRVTRIADHLSDPIDVLEFKRILLDALKGAEAVETYEPDEEDREKISELARNKYRSSQWTFGRNPSFNVSCSRRYPLGQLTVKLLVNQSVIEDCHFEGDYLGWLDTAEVARALAGTAYEREAVDRVLQTFEGGAENDRLHLYFGGLKRNEIVAAIMGDVSNNNHEESGGKNEF